ncbi:FAD-dependent oxidoreductase [Bradyrhizobium tropiciagri]|uniref:NAD(P)/FAD-dependent oxidoreductase n=1 Tax=Bradyrhizobium tropiciagri TaxID=312253 RepID=UPI001BA6BF2B|nr:FAD-dependent oxidoreductase [Bradyrhizobium tropiciagri]MBR0896764.1 FAD-dependent oxidoreductase [Bradyrhizobium tropiciagri]
MSERQRLVIVGAGLAGWRAATELRRLTPRAEIHLFGDEPELPYDRPPLSKRVLLGNDTPRYLTDGAALAAADIDFHCGIAVTKLHPDDRSVRCADGMSVPYDLLLLTTGSRPRVLPQAVANDVPIRYLRRRIDAIRLRDEITTKKELIIIGGGFIGLEVAAAAAMRGCRIKIFEAGEHILGRVAPAQVAKFIQHVHESHGSTIVTSAVIRRCLSDGRRVGVELACGDIHWADIIVAGTGIVPNVELAAAAGLKCDDGIVVDGSCRTSRPEIFAAGEVTRHPIAGYAGLRRVESWKTASEQPRVAAQTMLGMVAQYNELPWAWSDQFDTNLQILGFPDLAIEYRLDGDHNAQRLCAMGLDAAGKVVAAFAINDGRAISRLRRLVSIPICEQQTKTPSTCG